MRRVITTVVVAALILAGQSARAEPADQVRVTGGARDSASIRGRITDVRTGDAVIAATVELVGQGSAASAISGRLGEYVIDGVAAGVYHLRVQHPGYAPSRLALTVGAGARLMLDLPLDLAPIQLEPIVARTTTGGEAANDTTRVTINGHGPATPYLLSSAPPAMTLAGASRADDPDTGGPGDVFLVRGFTADLKRTMLDDAPIHTAFHMGGIMDPLPAGLVQAVTVHSGGAPARYDGGLTWVMDVRSRDPAPGGFGGRLAVDWLTAQGHIEGSLGDVASVLVSGRGTLSGAAETLLDRPLGYDYREAMLRTRTDMGGGATLRLTGFVNDESVMLPPREDPARWGSTLVSARLDAPRFAAVAAYSEGEVWLPASDDGAVAVDAHLRQGHLALEGRQPGPRASAAYGIQVDTYDFARSEPVGSANVHDEAARYTTAGAYADVSWQIEPRVRLHGGFRLNHFAPASAWRVSPRLALSWLVDERAMLTVSAGRFSQYVRVQDGAFRDPFALTPESYQGVRVADTIAPARSEMVVQEATHVTLSLDQRLSDHTRLELEGFVKDYGGIPAAEGDRLQASGLDVWIGSRGESLSGWFGYSLSWVWSRDDASSTLGEDRFNARQILSAGVTGRSASLGTLSVNASYGSGLPLTSVELERSPLRDGLLFEDGATVDAGYGDGLNSGGGEQLAGGAPHRTDRFLRIDIEASRTWQLGDGERSTTLTPYIRILNALDRRDAIFFHRDDGDGSVQPLATVPLLPLIGLEVRW